MQVKLALVDTDSRKISYFLVFELVEKTLNHFIVWIKHQFCY